MKFSCLILTSLLLTSCASMTVTRGITNYEIHNDVGSVTIYGTRNVRIAYITLNDSLIIQGDSFKKLKLDSVSVGKHTVKIISKQTWGRELHDETFEITVRTNSNTDIISNVPSGTGQNVAFLSLIGLFASLPFLFL